MAKYNFTDLVLLVGTNPLPNYVVAKYFIKNETNLQKIWLVHSEEGNGQGTKEFSRYLKEVLTDEFSDLIKHIKFHEVALSDIGSAVSIVKDIRTKLLRDFSSEFNTRSLHLNYTGGTKAMAVHVYRALEQDAGDRCSFSYLDARRFALVYDNTGDVSGDLRDEISISLDNLIKLHGCRKVKGKEGKCTEEGLRQFREILRINNEKDEFDNKIKGINGYCLERYVYEILKEKISTDEGLKGKEIPVEANWQMYNRNSGKTFELDLIVLNGYQVYCISCGKALRDDSMKLKGMEVIHRANQIGGEESRAILVTCLDDEGIRRISDDLETVTGSDKKLKVLGRSHLKEDVLWREIKEYIFD
jgi:hypothetical protein